jgi:hypothetical protein
MSIKALRSQKSFDSQLTSIGAGGFCTRPEQHTRRHREEHCRIMGDHNPPWGFLSRSIHSDVEDIYQGLGIVMRAPSQVTPKRVDMKMLLRFLCTCTCDVPMLS